jgi:hypothetical protein
VSGGSCVLQDGSSDGVKCLLSGRLEASSVFVAVIALILVWIALQTLGGPSPKS